MTRTNLPASVSEARRRKEGTECAQCGAELRRSAYETRLSSGPVLRCLRCALIHRTMVQRSLLVGSLWARC